MKTFPFGLRASHSELERFGTIELGEVGVPEEKDEWDELIEQLQDSPSFATTHHLIGKLSRNSYWTALQVEDLCRAAVDNSQVGMLINDDDVLRFYKRLLSGIVNIDEIIKQVIEMLDDGEEDMRGNDWKELEAGV